LTYIGHDKTVYNIYYALRVNINTVREVTEHDVHLRGNSFQYFYYFCY